MKKTILFSFALALFAATISGQNVNFEWAKSMGGTNTDYAFSIATDASGNVYTTGTFRDNVDFDPGPDTLNLSSAGGSDIFIQKLDPNGNLIWAVSMGGTGSDYGNSISTDSSGNVYTTGSFIDTVDFDPGPGTLYLSSVGYRDIFIQKLDPNGNFLWARSMGGTSTDYGYSITTDAIGNVYTTGYFSDTVDFDPDVGSFNLTSAGGTDIFIQKLDPNGNLILAISMGGAGSDYGNSITIDNSGNVYTTGYFEGTADFDPAAGTHNLTTNGFYDIFIQKIDPNGNLIWAKSMGSTSVDVGNSITTDTSGNVYTTGYFFGTVDFDPGVDTLDLTSVGWDDIFIQKLDPNGNLLWARSMGSTTTGGVGIRDVGKSIVTDANGNVYTTGYFSDTVDFDPDVGSFNLTSAGGTDIFIQKLDPNGNLILAISMGLLVEFMETKVNMIRY